MTVMVLKSVRYRSHSGPRDTNLVVFENVLQVSRHTIRELSEFTKLGSGYKSVVQRFVRNMIRQNLSNDGNQLIAQFDCRFSDVEVIALLGIKTNFLREFTSENATIHVTASAPHGSRLDINRLDVLDLSFTLPCGMLKYCWHKKAPPQTEFEDSYFEDSYFEDSFYELALDTLTWVDVLPHLIVAHVRWKKFDFNMHTLEEAWIHGLL